MRSGGGGGVGKRRTVGGGGSGVSGGEGARLLGPGFLTITMRGLPAGIGPTQTDRGAESFRGGDTDGVLGFRSTRLGEGLRSLYLLPLALS